MDCHHVRCILAYALRPVEGVDAAEQHELRQHLEQCPDCAALAEGERRTDDVLGAALREVPVPPGLQERLLGHLAAQRRPLPYGWIGAAASVLLALALVGVWYSRLPTRVRWDEFAEMLEMRANPSAANEELLQTHGINPGDFDHRYLRGFELIDFKGKRVPKLSYFCNNPQGGATLAYVYVLSLPQFNVSEHEFPDEPGRSTGVYLVRVQRYEDQVHLIVYDGDLQLISRRPV
jgi:hypothetical protein